MKRIIFLLALWWPCAVSAELLLLEGFVRGLPPGQKVTAAFMTLSNTGTQDVVLVAAQSDVAENLEFHQHSHEGGMMRMRQVAQLSVPAGEELELSPGHLHLMLIGLQRTLKEGDKVEISLCDARSECLAVELPVVSVLNE